MNPIEGRESAYVTSRVTDNSLISNSLDYVAQFACITPKSSAIIEEGYSDQDVDGNKFYKPYLVRDEETLDKVFGDPRIDPTTFKDLYAVRNLVQSGVTCYVCKVYSGDTFSSVLSSVGLVDPASITGELTARINAQALAAAATETTPAREAYVGREWLVSSSNITGTSSVRVYLRPAKPYSINQVYLTIELLRVLIDETAEVVSTEVISSASVLLSTNIKNSDLVATINAYLNSDLHLKLADVSLEDTAVANVKQAYDLIEDYENISNTLLWICGLYDKREIGGALIQSNMEFHTKVDALDDSVIAIGLAALSPWPKVTSSKVAVDGIAAGTTFTLSEVKTSAALLEVGVEQYARAFTQYKDLRYTGTFISELAADKASIKTYHRGLSMDRPFAEVFFKVGTVVTSALDDSNNFVADFHIKIDGVWTLVEASATCEKNKSYAIKTVVEEVDVYTAVIFLEAYMASGVEELSAEERRALHYTIKEVAASRKDLICIFTTPFQPTDDTGNLVNFDVDRACNWVGSRGDYVDLFEYGNIQAHNYSAQSFYCEMYWSWLKWKVVKIVNGQATGTTYVIVPATSFVILNALQSFKARGVFYPVAGNQGGVLPNSCEILSNPSLKSERDQLVSCRINPVYDTGTRGVQIYGNETLNAPYSDLSAAHISRTLVSIRSQVDNYSEKVKFSLNNLFTWTSWINYVTSRILDPIKSAGGLQWFSVDMGYNTTTREEISQRKIKGIIKLQFVQSLEIIDLNFDIQASSLDLES